MILDALLTSFCSSTKVVLASASPRRAELLRQLGIARFEVRPSSFAEDLPKTPDGATTRGRRPRPKQKKLRRGRRGRGRKKRKRRRRNNFEARPRHRSRHRRRGRFPDLEKPSETDGGLEGTEMLRRLSGREHRVSTGVALVLVPARKQGRKRRKRDPAGKVFLFSETTVVRFAELPDSEIDAYVASGENLGKAGGYGIQVRGGRSFFLFFSRRSGSFLSPSLSSLLFSLFDLLFYHQKQIDQGPAGAFVEGIQGCYFNVVGLPLHSLAREVAA